MSVPAGTATYGPTAARVTVEAFGVVHMQLTPVSLFADAETCAGRIGLNQAARGVSRL